MMPNAPEPDPCALVRDEIRQILVDEDRTCLGVKVRPPIPASDEERTALAKLGGLDGPAASHNPPGPRGCPRNSRRAGSRCDDRPA
jgi:hypothetical protein